MRKGETAKKAEKLTIYILVLSIICLILMSLLPWISVAENDLVKQDLHFNFEMMKESGNGQIMDLASDLNLINISFWALIILSLLSLLGTTIHASGKFSVVGHILLLIGCVTFVFSIFVIILQLIISQNIGNMRTISASAIYSPINYAYILLIPSFFIFICSALYTWTVFEHSIQKFKSSKKAKDDKKEKKTAKKLSKKERKTKAKEKPAKEKPSLEPKIDEKRVEMEQWLTGQVQDMEKQAAEEKPTGPEKEKISQEPHEEPKETYVFPLEKTEEETEETDEVRASKSFEDALSSAIQKKQTEVISKEKKTSEEKEEISPKIEEPAKGIFSVRCPQCKHIFTVKREEGITKIKCPECGKEGTIK